MHSSVFVYGTLQYSKILDALLGRVPSSEQAIIKGYVRYGVRGEPFPAVVKAQNDESDVSGLLLSGLSPHEMDILDEYEGEQYTKCEVDAFVKNTVECRKTLIYIWKDEYVDMLDGKEWDRDAFEQEHFDWYYSMVTDTKKSSM